LQQLVEREVGPERRLSKQYLPSLKLAKVVGDDTTVSLSCRILNIFLHNRLLFNEILWPSALSARGDVNIVVPIVVVDELDRLKRSGREDTKTRARVTLRTLQQMLPTPDAVVRLLPDDEHRRSTTLEVLVDPIDRVPLAKVDHEILDRASSIVEISGRAVQVVTSDNGMRLRAMTYGLSTAILPDQAD